MEIKDINSYKDNEILKCLNCGHVDIVKEFKKGECSNCLSQAIVPFDGKPEPTGKPREE